MESLDSSQMYLFFHTFGGVGMWLLDFRRLVKELERVVSVFDSELPRLKLQSLCTLVGLNLLTRRGLPLDVPNREIAAFLPFQACY